MFTPSVDKRISKLELNAKKVKMLEKSLKLLIKDFNAFSKKILADIKENEIALKKEKDYSKKLELGLKKEIDAINKELSIFNDKHKSVSKKITNILNTESTLKKDIKTAKNTINRINRAFNITTLNRLRTDMNILSDTIVELRKQGQSNLKKFAGVSKKIANTAFYSESAANSARETELKSLELNKKAKELEGLAGQYFNKTEEINKKINASVSALSDLTKIVNNLNEQVSYLQNRLTLLDSLKEQVENQKAILSDIKRRVEYIDKTCTKTIVLE